MKPKAGIIGTGNIGSELYRKLQKKGWAVRWVIDSEGVYRDMSKKEKIDDTRNYENYFSDLDIIFLAIPTLDDGKTAFDYISSSLEKKIPIVTCEKGALSNYFSELEEKIEEEKIGYSATVGGGSRLLKYLEERRGPQITEIHAVINGTLNYIFYRISNGSSLGEAVEETKRLGYAEPGSKKPLDVINKEATGDVPMKAAILFNISNFCNEYMRAKDVKPHRINTSELKKLLKEATNRRYIVSITREKNKEEDVIWGFKHNVGDWYISAGFKHINDNPLFKKLVPSGVDNAILISEGEFGRDGSYVISGPGAGPGPTTNSMIIDAERILKIRKP